MLPRISRNVLFLGLTSLFTDVSSEMLTAVLPLYFMLELKMSPLQVGLIDGLYQGASALVRVASGVVADSGRRYKSVAVVGYALSTVCKAGLLGVGGAWGAITGLLMLDRIGKGIRTAPRDALITLSSDPARLGESFGAHRAMDTVGAVLGPVLAFGILALAPSAYDAVFVVSLAFGVVGVALIALFVENQRGAEAPQRPLGARAGVASILRNTSFARLLAAGVFLSVLTATDALIYLLLQRAGAVPPTVFPLLFVGTSAVYLLLALPVGRLADRVGRRWTFAAGHVGVLGIYLVLLFFPSLSLAGVLFCVAMLGVYYAATDGVLSALAATTLPTAQVTTGLAVVSTAVALSRLVAAAFFGALWSWFGPAGAVGAFAAGLALALGLAAWLFARMPVTEGTSR